MTSSVEKKLPRPPIVAIMGHVDHGKTTLLDYIRKTNIASREAGGITQSLGAYEITHEGKQITFLDTPGHEAFSRMRAHGARVADLVVLVVAADDSVKPQTKDALRHIHETKTPFIVAITKIDKPGADIQKVTQDLIQCEVFLEGSGGSTSWHTVSGVTGEGVSDLLDLILLATDVEHLVYEPDGVGEAIVLSSRLDARRGLVVGVIIKNGTLSRGVVIHTPTSHGKIKILENFLGKSVQTLSPSAPAIIIGFEEAPAIGEIMRVGVREIASTQKKNIMSANTEEKKEGVIGVIIKANETSSLEALHDIVRTIAETAPLSILAESIGDIYENDVKNAESTGAIILGFNVRIDRAAQNMVYAKKVNCICSPIIYELERFLKEYMKKMVSKEVRTIEVLAIFGASKGKQRVAGGRVIMGPIRNQESFEIWYDKKLIGIGRILNLQSGRKDVQSADTGSEVGFLVETEEPIKVGHRLVFPEI